MASRVSSPKWSHKTVGALSLALSILGLVAQFAIRWILLHEYGAGPTLDGYYLALIPAVFISNVGFQALASVVIPLLSDLIEEGRGQSAQSFLKRVNRIAFLWSGALSLLITGAAAAWGPFPYDDFILTVFLCQWVWGVLQGLSVVQRQVLLFFNRPLLSLVLSLLPAFTVLLVFALQPFQSIFELIASTALGQLLSLGLGWWVIEGEWAERSQESESSISSPELKTVFLSALPVFLASINAQIMLAIDQSMAAWWSVGALTLFGTALTLYRLPHTLAETLMRSLTYAELLKLCGQSDSESRSARLSRVFVKMIRVQAFLLVPAALIFVSFGEEIVVALFGYGRFSLSQCRVVYTLLLAFPLYSLGHGLQSAQVTLLVAMKKASRVLAFELALTAFSVLLNILFLPWLGLAGLLASSAVSIVCVSLLIFHSLRELKVVMPKTEILRDFAPVFFAGIGMGIVLLLCRQFLSAPESPSGAFFNIALGVVPASLLYLLVFGALLNRSPKGAPTSLISNPIESGGRSQ